MWWKKWPEKAGGWRVENCLRRLGERFSSSQRKTRKNWDEGAINFPFSRYTPAIFFFGETLFLFCAKAIIGFPRKYFGAFPFIFLLNFSFYIISLFFALYIRMKLTSAILTKSFRFWRFVFVCRINGIIHYLESCGKFLIETRSFHFSNMFIW